MLDDFFNSVGDLFNNVTSGVGDWWNNITNDIGNTVSNVIDSVNNGVVGYIQNGVNDLTNYVSQQVQYVPQIVQDMAQATYIPQVIQQVQQTYLPPQPQPILPAWQIPQIVFPTWQPPQINFGPRISPTQLITQNQQQYFNRIEDLNRPLDDGFIPNYGDNKIVNGKKYVYQSREVGYVPDVQTPHLDLSQLMGALTGDSINNSIPDIGNWLEGILGSLNGGIDLQSNDLFSFINSLVGQLTNWVSGIIPDMNINLGDIGQSISQALDGGLSSVIQQVQDWTSDTFYSTLGAIDRFSIEAQQQLDIVSSDFKNFAEQFIGTYSNKTDAILTEVAAQHQQLIGVMEAQTRHPDIDTIGALNAVLTAMLDPTTDIFTKIQRVIEAVNEFIKGLGQDVGKYIDNEIDSIFTRIGNAFKYSTEVFSSLANDLQRVVLKLKRGEYKDFDSFYNDLSKATVNTDLLSFAQALFILIPAMGQFLLSDLKPIVRELEYLKNTEYPTVLPNFDTVQAMYLKQFISRDSAYEVGRKYGLSDQYIEMLLEYDRPQISGLPLRDLLLRDVITEEQHDFILARQGFNEESIRQIKELYYPIPNPQDLISMAVKEAFSPEIAEAFGQYEDFPVEFAEWAAKQGISETWAKRYWASHWTLPSPQMGFEMFQRDIIDNAELQLLLKALDVMPHWREKLIQLNYNPLTRVDIRRMYKLGVVDRDEMFTAYRYAGYSPKNAELLSQFTEKYESADGSSYFDGLDKKIVTTIENMYKNGKLSKEEALTKFRNLGIGDNYSLAAIALMDIARQDEILPDKSRDNIARIEKLVTKEFLSNQMSKTDVYRYLTGIGYTDTEATTEVNLLQLELDSKNRTDFIQYAEEMYVGRSYDENQLRKILGDYGFNAAEMASIVFTLNAKRELRTKKPSETEIRKFYALNIITEPQFVEELRGLGYTDKYVAYIVIAENMNKAQ